MPCNMTATTLLRSAMTKVGTTYYGGGAPSVPSGDRAAIMLALGINTSPQPTGTTYYLDNTHGSASDSNDGLSASSPWLTLNKALTTLTAGDMVVGKGTYTHAADITPTNSGTAGNPIIYRAETARNFIVDQQGNYDGFRLDTNSINYTVLDGLEIRDTYGSDGGGGVFTKDDNESIHVFNCYIHDIDCNSGGNSGGIRFDKQTGGVAFNNIIETVRVGGVSNNNAAGIHGYGHDEAILAFNKISDVENGLDAKNSITVNNWKLIGNDIDVNNAAIYVNVIGASQTAVAILNTQVYNNLIRRGAVNFECYEHAPQSEDMVFRNNVLLEKGVVNYQLKDAEYYDNIFDFDSTNEATTAITTQRRDNTPHAVTTCSIIYSDYNNYHSGSKFTTNRYAQEGGSEVTRMSLATWQAQTTGDGFGTIQVDNPDSNSTQLSNTFDADYITQNASLLTGGRYGGAVGLEYQAGPDWSAL